jgi:Amidohydrolase
MMANAHALEESCLPIVEEMISKGGAKAIAVSSSYGDGTNRIFLDSPKAEWLWEYAEANDIVVHIHPPTVAQRHESLMQYRLNEAVGRPFDSTVTAARMIGSGVFDRHPKLQVLIVHLGGGLTSTIGRPRFQLAPQLQRRRQPAGRPALHEQAEAIGVLQDQPPGRLHGVQRTWAASNGRDVRRGPGRVRLRLRRGALRDQRACADRRGRAPEPG